MALFGGSQISEGSKSTYMSKLKKLNGNKVPTDVQFLKKYKEHIRADRADPKS